MYHQKIKTNIYSQNVIFQTTNLKFYPNFLLEQIFFQNRAADTKNSTKKSFST